jgi:hypothetical protein
MKQFADNKTQVRKTNGDRWHVHITTIHLGSDIEVAIFKLRPL